jgi:hypothetical protein
MPEFPPGIILQIVINIRSDGSVDVSLQRGDWSLLAAARVTVYLFPENLRLRNLRKTRHCEPSEAIFK